MYKTIFQHILYLINIKSPKARRSLTSLRLSSNNLAVETGPYSPKVVRYHRFCRQCDEMDVEDEFHFLLKCPRYQNLRVKFIPRYYTTHVSLAKYMELMELVQVDVELCKQVSTYITSALLCRI